MFPFLMFGPVHYDLINHETGYYRVVFGTTVEGHLNKIITYLLKPEKRKGHKHRITKRRAKAGIVR